MGENANSVKTLAGLDIIKTALEDVRPGTLAAANPIPDHFRRSLDVSASYLMNAGGLTIASSNRRRFDEALREEWRRLCRNKAFFSLILGADEVLYKAKNGGRNQMVVPMIDRTDLPD